MYSLKIIPAKEVKVQAEIGEQVLEVLLVALKKDESMADRVIIELGSAEIRHYDGEDTYPLIPYRESIVTL